MPTPLVLLGHAAALRGIRGSGTDAFGSGAAAAANSGGELSFSLCVVYRREDEYVISISLFVRDVCRAARAIKGVGLWKEQEECSERYPKDRSGEDQWE